VSFEEKARLRLATLKEFAKRNGFVMLIHLRDIAHELQQVAIRLDCLLTKSGCSDLPSMWWILTLSIYHQFWHGLKHSVALRFMSFTIFTVDFRLSAAAI